MRALVIANGQPPSAALVAEFLPGADMIVAADGGADSAIALGLTPSAVVGDLDSISSSTREALPGANFHKSVDPDTTDLEKAIAFALGQGATSIDVLGAGGNRADHALANLSCLAVFRGSAPIRIIDDLFEVTLVDGAATIEGSPATVISLIAIGRCEGVTTRNLRWDLHDAELDFSSLGVHNEIAQSPARVSLRQGTLLLFKGRWIEKHR